MERTACKTKLPRHIVGGEMKQVADPRKPPVVVPVVVIAVHVHITLVVPVVAVEGREAYKIPSVPPPKVLLIV